MNEVQWGRLARLQDQIAKTEDLRHRQRQNYHKAVYKNSLQQMINDRKAQAKTIEERDRLFYHEMYKSSNSQQISPEKQKFEKLLKLSSHENYTTGRQRKKRIKSEIEDERHILSDKYKKVATQLEEEREKQWKEKEYQKKQLSNFYEEQIQGVDSKKYLQRLENQKFQQIAAQLQQRKEQQRINHINKIRFGYLQNPQAYNIVKDIYKQKQEQKQYFLNKMENSRLEEDPKEKIKQKKHFQTIEVGRFNKNNFLQRQLKKKQFQNKEVQSQNIKLLNIQRELNEEQQRIRLKKLQERNNLKNNLEHQILEHEEGKALWKRMSENESKINQGLVSNKKSLLPGLNKDYKDKKQEVIIDSFLNALKSGSTGQAKF